MKEDPKVVLEGSDAPESTEEDPKMVPEAEEDPKAIPEEEEGPKAGPEVSVEHKSTEKDPKIVAPQITCDKLVGKK